MSRGTFSRRAASKPPHVKYKEADKMKNLEMKGVLEKFSISEQVKFRRNFEELPSIIAATWRDNFKCLDLQDFQQQLIGEGLSQFLQKMRRHFRSVRFKSEQLQDQLNVLEKSGITELPGVRECEISCDTNKGDSISQWPLHALPKLLCRLNCLKMHMPVQVGFIEHFHQLKSLILHNEVSAEALAAIWGGCGQLLCVQLLGRGNPSTIGISQCQEMSELTLPVVCFNASNAFEILQLPQLQFLELQQKDESAEATIDAMSLVLRQRAHQIQIMQLNGRHLGNVKWLLKLELQLCQNLEGITLIDCQFDEFDVSTLGLLPVLSYAAFSSCPDLKDVHVLDFVKISPRLTQLYLIGCTQLTRILISELCNLRCKEYPTAAPLGLYLQDCEALLKEYKLHFIKQSSLKLLKTPQEDHQMQHVQFFFLSN